MHNPAPAAEPASIDSPTFRRILDHIPVPIICTRAVDDRAALFINEAFCRTFGYSFEEIAQLQDWADRAFPVPAEREEFLRRWTAEVDEAVEHAGVVESLAFTVTCQDGSRRETVATALPFQDLLLVSVVDVTEQRRSQAQQAELHELKQRIALELTGNLPIGTFVLRQGIGARPHFEFVNQQLLTLLDLSGEELMAHAGLAVGRIHPDDAEDFRRQSLAGFDFHESHTWEGRLLVDGRVRWVHIEAAPRQLEDGSVALDGAVSDITDRKEAEAALAASEQHYRLLAENSSDVVLHMAMDGTIQWVSPSLTAMLGWSPDDWIGRNGSEFLLPGTNASDAANIARLSAGQAVVTRDRIRAQSGAVHWVETHASPFRDGSGRIDGLVATFRVVDLEVSAEQELSRRARRDQLTGLPNRMGFEEAATIALARAQRGGSRLALFFIDLDRFKLINDTLGHHIGDRLLVEVARRLETCVRSTDLLARLGGDEFVLIADTITHQNDAAEVAMKIRNELEQPIQVDSHELHTSPSVGISLFPDDGRDLQSLMQQADTAMYEVKARGRNGWQFFTPEMNAAVQERHQLETDIRAGLERNEFQLHYQPQWRGRQRRPIGWEALLRWHHPGRGWVSPQQFLPVAEETGLIQTLGERVLRKACREARGWSEAGLGDFLVAVNLSHRQFHQADLAERIEAVLGESGLAADRLELEISESVLMDDAPWTRRVLDDLKGLGVQIAMDDFGTGYSSLSLLRALPIDRLKIDRSFVREAPTEANAAAIVRTILSMAQSLGMGSIAVGVESEQERNFLLELRCQDLQGNLLAEPMPAEAIPAFLAANGEALTS